MATSTIDKGVTKKARRLLRSYSKGDKAKKDSIAVSIKEIAKALTPELKKTYSEKYGYNF